MVEDPAPRPVAGWFKFAAIASILFMAVGCVGYLMDVTTDPDTLPIDQRALVLARPIWQVAAYATAVWVGLLGAILLLMRKKASEPLLLVSLVAACFTFLPLATVPAIRDNVSTNDISFAVVIVLITATIWQFARNSRKRGWLR